MAPVSVNVFVGSSGTPNVTEPLLISIGLLIEADIAVCIGMNAATPAAPTASQG